MLPKPKRGMTLGQYLRQAMDETRLSIRGLSGRSGVHRSAIERLLRDEVDEPLPSHLVALAEALEVRTTDLFMLAGLPIPQDLPSVDALLRAEYDLSEEGLAEAKRQIAAIAAQERAKDDSNS